MRGNRVCIESVPHKGPKKTFCQLLVAFKMFLVVSHILHLLQPPSLADKTTRIALYDYLEREGERGVRREERRFLFINSFCFGTMPLIIIIEERQELSRH